MDINLLPHNLIKTNFNWMLRFILDTLNSRHLDYCLSYLCSLKGKEFCWKFLEVTSEMEFTMHEACCGMLLGSTSGKEKEEIWAYKGKRACAGCHGYPCSLCSWKVNDSLELA